MDLWQLERLRHGVSERRRGKKRGTEWRGEEAEKNPWEEMRVETEQRRRRLGKSFYSVDTAMAYRGGHVFLDNVELMASGN